MKYVRSQFYPKLIEAKLQEKPILTTKLNSRLIA